MDSRSLTTTTFLGLAVACGAGVDLVPTGPHRLDAPQLPVAEPPPPSKVETIPDQPRSECRWLDGRWEYAASEWQWLPGAWVVPPEGCHFAGATTAWATGMGSDVLYFRPGQWVHESPGQNCPEPARCETRRVIVDEP